MKTDTEVSYDESGFGSGAGAGVRPTAGGLPPWATFFEQYAITGCILYPGDAALIAKEIRALTEQRDALLAALRDISDDANALSWEEIRLEADAAIAKAEGA